jgi:serine/threonine protein kinase
MTPISFARTAAPEAGEQLHPGLELAGRYRLERPLGAGGMGTVWEAHDLVLDRMVAVKLAAGSGAESLDDSAVARMMREARLAASVSHPTVVAVFDVGIERGRPFVVMELLEGSTLHDALRRGGLRATEVVSIAAGVAEALRALHGHGIVHGDVKPANVFLTGEGRPKLGDLGVSVLAEGRSDRSDTGGDARYGTQPYVAPEVTRGAAPEPAADLYALGVTLSEMAASVAVEPAAPGSPGAERDGVRPLDVRLVDTMFKLSRLATVADPAQRPTASHVASVLETLDRAAPAGRAATTIVAGTGGNAASTTELAGGRGSPTLVLPGPVDTRTSNGRAAPTIRLDAPRPPRGRSRGIMVPAIWAAGIVIAALIAVVVTVAALSNTSTNPGAGPTTHPPVRATAPSPHVVAPSPVRLSPSPPPSPPPSPSHEPPPTHHGGHGHHGHRHGHGHGGGHGPGPGGH